MKFTKTEKRKIAAVLAAQQQKFKAGLSDAGYNNGDGGCPNCGDTGGFHTLMYELERAFGLKRRTL